MPSFVVRDISDDLLSRIKARAESEGRSPAAAIRALMEQYADKRARADVAAEGGRARADSLDAQARSAIASRGGAAGGRGRMGFASLLRRAQTLSRLDPNPRHDAWWRGYMQGLRRAHHGEAFGTAAEHERLFGDTGDLGVGYRSGMTLQPLDPPDDAPLDRGAQL